MKVIVRPIEMICLFKLDGEPRPLRFRYKDDDESYKVIKIDKIFNKKLEKIAGYETIIFRCQSLINGIQKVFEIRFELKTNKWILYKI